MINKNLCIVSYMDIDTFVLRNKGDVHIRKANIDIIEAYKYIYRQSNSIIIIGVR